MANKKIKPDNALELMPLDMLQAMNDMDFDPSEMMENVMEMEAQLIEIAHSISQDAVHIHEFESEKSALPPRIAKSNSWGSSTRSCAKSPIRTCTKSLSSRFAWLGLEPLLNPRDEDFKGLRRWVRRLNPPRPLEQTAQVLAFRNTRHLLSIDALKKPPQIWGGFALAKPITAGSYQRCLMCPASPET